MLKDTQKPKCGFQTTVQHVLKTDLQIDGLPLPLNNIHSCTFNLIISLHESPIMVIHHPAKPFTSSTPKMLGFQAIRIARKISSKGKCDGAPDMEANGHETSDIFWHFGGVCKTLSVT